MLKSFFDKEYIEYFAVLRYGSCKLIRPDIMARQNLLPKSVIVYLIPYYAGETVNISRYASALDYHLYIKELNLRLEDFLRNSYPKNNYKGYGDSSPIDERHAALISGLGILGTNRLVINEKYGSYVFIGEMMTDIDPELLGAADPCEINSCRKCGICQKNCPTGSLIDSTAACLSEITQKKGELSDSEKEIIRKCGTVWGCDACQVCCPHNRNVSITPIEFFRQGRIEELSEQTLCSMSDDEFKMRAFSWRGRKTVERNIKHIMKND